MAKITYADKVALNENPNVNAINKVRDVDMNEIKEVINDNETKVLLAVSSSAPATCDTGDIYFNTADNLIYTATATNTWSSTGIAPTENTIYIEFTSQTAYAYDGTTLVSVGGGSGPQIVNDYSTSQENAYSCNYSNKAFGGTILWTNDSPNGAFASQSVPLDLSNYDGIAIIYIIESGAGWGRMIKNTGIMPIQSTRPICMEGTIVENTSSSTFAFRSATVSSTGIAFGTGYNNVTNSGAATRDYACVPWYIIGYKTGLFPTQQSTRSLNTYSGDIEEKKDIVIDDGNK